MPGGWQESHKFGFDWWLVPPVSHHSILVSIASKRLNAEVKSLSKYDMYSQQNNNYNNKTGLACYTWPLEMSSYSIQLVPSTAVPLANIGIQVYV